MANHKINNIISIVILAGLVALLTTTTSSAADTGTVTATVTAQNISVTVTDGSVAYGTVGLSSSSDTTSTGVDDSQTATNNGNVNETINIKDSGSTAAWTIAGTAGANQYVHSFCKTNCDSTPTWTPLTANYQELAASVASSGTQVFDLKLNTPTSTSSYTEQSLSVTIQATI